MQSKERCRMNTCMRADDVSEEAAKVRGAGGPGMTVSHTPGRGGEQFWKRWLEKCR